MFCGQNRVNPELFSAREDQSQSSYEKSTKLVRISEDFKSVIPAADLGKKLGKKLHH